ncbi:MAG TPA: TlpA disulfide reductase family protein [Thermoanaerobaculia bacterium]|nr:TlpA disulfide reductase family protein [Thermoanaerobaculia bacterium]
MHFPAAKAAEPPSPPEAVARREPGLGRQANLVVAVLAVLALAVLFWPRRDDRFDTAGLVDASGQAATLEPLLTPVTLVHFWATWCAPCMDEIPALRRLQDDMEKNDDFRVVMIAVSDSTDKVQAFLGSGAGSVLYDPDWKVANSYGTDKLPETYLVVNGHVVEKFVGQTDWDAPALRQKLAARLSGGDRTGPTGS